MKLKDILKNTMKEYNSKIYFKKTFKEQNKRNKIKELK